MLHPHSSIAKVGAGLALLVAACDGRIDTDEEPEVAARADASRRDVSEGRSAIVGGTEESGRSAVVALVTTDSAFGDVVLCSGVLITPTIVLTAAHCLHPHVTGIPAEELVVVFGSHVDSPLTRISVVSGAYSPEWRADDPNGEGDIGAVRLASAAPVDPIALGPAPMQGGRVVIVGYGSVSPDETSMGVKRSGDALVGEVGETWFRVERAPSTTCAGDSGGATLADVNGAEVLLGIHSRGDCVSELWNERLDIHANGFLRDFMGEYGGCNADGACALGCPDPDPDCPCAADDICSEDCRRGEDPDCDDVDACEELPQGGATETCCDDGACDPAIPSAGAGWGSAGCSVSAASGEPSDAGGEPSDAIALLGLAAISLASRRRSARGGSSRSDS